jgi:carboxyl-terminal processing protease
MRALIVACTIAFILSRECSGWVSVIRKTSSKASVVRIDGIRKGYLPACQATLLRDGRLYEKNNFTPFSVTCRAFAKAGVAIPLALLTTLQYPGPATASQQAPIFTPSLAHETYPRQVSESRGRNRLDQDIQAWISSDLAAARPLQSFSPPSRSSTTLLSLDEQPMAQQEYSMLDEVWTLINKYYIDRSFNHQDWNAIKDKFQTKLAQTNGLSDQAESAIVSEMVQTLQDKYSRILDKAAYSAIQKYDLIGIGVTLMPDPSTQLIVVGAPPIQGSASAIAGLKQGDWVTAINGVSTMNRNAFDIINQIAEQPNAPTIDMTIVPRDHMSESFQPNQDSGSLTAVQRTVTMPRAFAQVRNPVIYKISENRADGTKVGYIRISEFNALIKTKLEDALHDLIDKQGANALVLDIRHNGGGAFQSAVEISSLFFSNKVATYVVDQSSALIPFKTAMADVQVPATIPVAIWLDGQSASASEVFAGSLHDQCRAVTMGERSFGKGLIQAVYGLKNGAGLVLTVARYVTPNGLDIQGTGLQPDIPGHVAPPIPGLLSDTSGVDFAEIRQRLDPTMCKVPTSPLVAIK